MGFLKKMKAKLEDLNGFLKEIKAKLEDFLQLEEEWKACWPFNDMLYFHGVIALVKVRN